MFAKKSCSGFVRILGLRDEKIVREESLPKRQVTAVGRKVRQGGALRGNASLVDLKTLRLKKSGFVKTYLEKGVRGETWL